jgi:exoribonuclease R
MSNLRIGRLQLSTRNNYKINEKTAKKCFILDIINNKDVNNKDVNNDEKTVLIYTQKEFQPDRYVLVDINLKTVINTYGLIGNINDDLSIYYHMFTYSWLPKKKYDELFLKLFFKNNYEYDIVKERIIYENIVTTVDPEGSLDLDDGYYLFEDDNNYYLDIHIADPISYFNFSEDLDITMNIFDELINRLNTCYIDCPKINNLFPESFVKKVTLIGENKRSILFKTIINKNNNNISFEIQKTIIKNKINNMSYEKFDEYINSLPKIPSVNNNSIKNNIILVSNILIDVMNLNLPKINYNYKSISHNFIEIIMIWINFKTGNYLSNINNNIIIRVQEKKISENSENSQNIDTNVITFINNLLNYSASYKYIDSDKSNNFHNSLNLVNYCHISSPMRRFIDLYNHCIIHNSFDFINKYFISHNINLTNINYQIKKQKKISMAYDLIKFIHKNKDYIFNAIILKIKNNNTELENNTINKIVTLAIYSIELDFKKIIVTKIPYDDTLKLYTTFKVKLCYNSSHFKNNIFPFSIVIINKY